MAAVATEVAKGSVVFEGRIAEFVRGIPAEGLAAYGQIKAKEEQVQVQVRKLVAALKADIKPALEQTFQKHGISFPNSSETAQQATDAALRVILPALNKSGTVPSFPPTSSKDHLENCKVNARTSPGYRNASDTLMAEVFGFVASKDPPGMAYGVNSHDILRAACTIYATKCQDSTGPARITDQDIKLFLLAERQASLAAMSLDQTAFKR